MKLANVWSPGVVLATLVVGNRARVRALPGVARPQLGAGAGGSDSGAVGGAHELTTHGRAWRVLLAASQGAI